MVCSLHSSAKVVNPLYFISSQKDCNMELNGVVTLEKTEIKQPISSYSSMQLDDGDGQKRKDDNDDETHS